MGFEAASKHCYRTRVSVLQYLEYQSKKPVQSRCGVLIAVELRPHAGPLPRAITLTLSSPVRICGETSVFYLI